MTMYRLYGALAVLACVIVLAGTGFHINTTTADGLSEQLQAAYQLAGNGETTASAEHLQSAAALLQQHREWLCIFVSHQIIESIEQTITQAALCLQQQDILSFLLYCRSALDMTEDFSRLEHPYLHNIL